MYTHLKTLGRGDIRKLRVRFPTDLQNPQEVCSVSDQKQRIQRGRLLFLGDSLAGKTSSIKSLRGENFNLEEKKTRGVETHLVNDRWETIRESETVNTAEMVEAKLVAERAAADREKMLEMHKTTHEVYRAGLNSFFRKVEPYVGPSDGMRSLTFYLILTSIVAVLRLWRAATLDFSMFIGLEIYREIRTRNIDFRVWLITLYGILTGFAVGSWISLLLTKFWSEPFEELVERWPILCGDMPLTLIVFSVGELLMKLKGSIQGTRRLRNVLDLLDIPVDSSKFIHSCILGATFQLSLPEITCHPWLCDLVVLVILPLQIARIRMIKTPYTLKTKRFLVAFLVLPCICCFAFRLCREIHMHFFGQAFHLLVHACISWQHNRYNLHKYFENVSLISILTKPLQSLQQISEFLADQEQMQQAIAAIETIQIQLLDFAGDNDYYAYHHVYMTDKAIYAVVFDASLFVKETVDELEKALVKRILFWLESICIHATKECPVFLIGTHCSEISVEELKELDKLLQTELQSFCHKIVKKTNDKTDTGMFFPVENKNGPQDPGICCLREAIIHEAAQEECQSMFNTETPLSWIKLLDKINIESGKRTPSELCVKFEEFAELAKSCQVSDLEIPNVLEYVCHHGLCLFLGNREIDDPTRLHVLLRPQLFTDIIVKLVSHSSEPSLQERALRKDWQEALTKHGMLTADLLSHVLSDFPDDKKKSIKAFLEEFNLICSLEHPTLWCHRYVLENVTHFVPAMLPDRVQLPPGDKLWIPQTEDKIFYIYFEGLLPEAVFNCMMARAYKHTRLCSPDDSPRLSRHVGQFHLSSKQPYLLKLLKDESVIEVTFASPVGGVKPGDVLCQVAEMMTTVCKTHFKNLEFHCGPLCPSTNEHCPGEQTCSRSLLKHDQLGTQKHVFNVYPRCTDERKEVSFNCKNLSFESELGEWLPSKTQYRHSTHSSDARTPLHRASENEDLALIGELLTDSNVADINSRDETGNTPLQLAAGYGKTKAVHLLLSKGAGVNRSNNAGLSALHLAAMNDHAGVIEVIMKMPHADVDCKNDDGCTPLVLALKHSCNNALRCLLACNANTDICIEGQSSLHFAVDRNNIEAVKLLVIYGANVNTVSKTGDCETVLHYAVKKGYTDSVMSLLECGANVNATDISNRTPFHLAASSQDNPDILKLLLQKKADIHVQDFKGSTALHLAAQQNHCKNIRFLLSNGADCRVTDTKGKTALFIAAAENSVAALETILKFESSDPRIYASQEGTNTFVIPLMVAASLGQLEALQCLLRYVTNVNTTDSQGWSALHHAASEGHLNLVKILCQKGVDIAQQSNSGKTAADVANRRGRKEVYEFLREVCKENSKRQDLSVIASGIRFLESTKHQTAVPETVWQYKINQVLIKQEDRETEFKDLTKERKGKLPWKIMEIAKKFICGCLNSGRGGSIFCGVDDGGKVLGLSLNTTNRDHIGKAYQFTLDDHIKSDINFMSKGGDQNCVELDFIPVIEAEISDLYVVHIRVDRIWMFCKDYAYYAKIWKEHRRKIEEEKETFQGLKTFYKVMEQEYEDLCIRTNGVSKAVAKHEAYYHVRRPLNEKYDLWKTNHEATILNQMFTLTTEP